jgi:autophagy-related protein 2
MLRVQVRSSPPLHQAPRSGALIVDVHDIVVSNYDKRSQESLKQARFAGASNDSPRPPERSSHDSLFLSAAWSRVVASYVSQKQRRALGFLSLGAFGTAPITPHVLVIRAEPVNTAEVIPLKTVVTLAIPGICTAMNKETIDGLQFFADDATQLIERARIGSQSDTPKGSRDASLIGSRFFAQNSDPSNRSGSTSATATIQATEAPPRSETVLKVVVDEGMYIKPEREIVTDFMTVFARLHLPRHTEDNQAATQPFDLFASQVDALVELKPEGKVNTVAFSPLIEPLNVIFIG